MIRKIVTVWVSLAMLFGFLVIVDVVTDFTPTVRATTLYVNETGSGGAYMSIQDAINESSDGDTVYVYNGIYYENVVVNKTINLIGEERNTTIIDGYGSSYCILVNFINYVNISWISIRNATFGVYIESSSNCNISSNLIFNETKAGIGLNHSINNNIIDNSIYDIANVTSGWNELYGIYLNDSSENLIHENKIYNLTAERLLYGIYLVWSPNNIINSNQISNLTTDGRKSNGIYLWNCNNNTIDSNHIYEFSRNDDSLGIYLSSSLNNNITNNHIYNMSALRNIIPIRLSGYSNYNYVKSNIIYNHIALSSPGYIYGIYVHISYNNIMFSNLFFNFTTYYNSYGIFLYKSNNNTISSNEIYNLRSLTLNVAAIEIGAFSHNNTAIINIIHNLIADSYAHGIYLGAYSNHTQINSNHIYNFSANSTTWGIRSGMIMEMPLNNSFKENNIHGVKIGIDLTGINNNVVENHIHNITEKGISVSSYTHNNTVKSNFIENINGNDSKAYGIFISNANDNLFISNYLSNVSSNNMDAYGIYLQTSSTNNTFINCSISNTKTYDLHLTTDSHATLLNTSFNKSKVNFNDLDSTLTIQWFLNVNVTDYFGNPISNANVRVKDNENGSFDKLYITGSDGYVRHLIVTEFWQNQISKIYYTSHNITAWNNSLAGYSNPDPFMDKCKTVNLILDNRTLLYILPGWNLISIPFIQSDTNLGQVLSSIQGTYDAVQWFNATDPTNPWKHNSTSKPSELNDLDSIDHGMGFWIHITQPGGVLFEYSGTQPSSNQTIPLHPGWNMVGYPSLTSHNRTDGMNNLTFDDQVDAIWSYDAATQKWEEMGESDYFEIGKGYYIYAKSECEWEVPL